MFKFYKISHLDILDKIIGVNPTIKFSSIFELNDPFELKFNLNINFNDEIHKEAFLKKNPNSSDRDFESWKEESKDNERFLWDNEQKARNNLSQKINLCSFSKNKSNNLMWSHYTDNHKGICVEYENSFSEFLISNTDFIGSDSVSYSKTPPTVEIGIDPETIINKVLFNKQIEWKYEEEHRIIIRSKENVNYLPFPKKFIKAVYIGARANEELVSKVIDLCKPSRIKVFFGIALGKTYKVTFEEKKPGTIIQRSFWN